MSRWHGLFTAALACAALAASAQELTPGKDYGVVTPPQKTDDPSKIVVIEFFSYACPHCNALNPSLTLWENRLAKDVHFEREAVIFGRQPWQKLAQVHYRIEEKVPNLPPGGFEEVDGDVATFESAMLALRTADGVAATSMGAGHWAEVTRLLAEPVAAGLVSQSADGSLALTMRGRLLSNEVFGRLLSLAG